MWFYQGHKDAVERNIEKAVENYNLAASNQHQRAAFVLGKAYLDPSGWLAEYAASKEERVCCVPHVISLSRLLRYLTTLSPADGSSRDSKLAGWAKGEHRNAATSRLCVRAEAFEGRCEASGLQAV